MHHDFTDQKQDSKTVEEDVHTLLNSIEDTRKNGKLRKKEKKRKKKVRYDLIFRFNVRKDIRLS